MPREIAVFDTYMPTFVVLVFAGALLTWAIDRGLAVTGLYGVVWHPPLFRASVLVIVCSALGLVVYH